MNVPHKPRILIVEDDDDLARLLAAFFNHAGAHVALCQSAEQTRQALAKGHYDAVVLDLMLGEENGLELIPSIARSYPFTKVIVMTGFGTIDVAVDAMERGASSFITKDTNPEELVRRVMSHVATEASPPSAPATLADIGIVGRSAAVQELLEQIDQLKDVDATVLVLGESGTGKELVARALHVLSDRRAAPFEAVNCGAIPDNLLESELFGYRKGAFTDAKEDRPGLFEICNQGTLFLDEIGDMPASLQVKLLRVLQEKEIKPLGASQSFRVTTRVVCATHRDLEQEVKEGRFREDLYFRLSVFPIQLPSLRERREDIPELVRQFVDNFNRQYGKQVAYPDGELMAACSNFDWPGNVRQLQNALERGVVMSRDGQLHSRDLFPKPRQTQTAVSPSSPEGDSSPMPQVYQEAKDAFERSYLEKILASAHGNVSEAARMAGRFRSDIYRLIRKYGLDPQDYKL